MTKAITKPTGNLSMSDMMSSEGVSRLRSRTVNRRWTQTLNELNLGYKFVYKWRTTYKAN